MCYGGKAWVKAQKVGVEGVRDALETAQVRVQRVEGSKDTFAMIERQRQDHEMICKRIRELHENS